MRRRVQAALFMMDTFNNGNRPWQIDTTWADYKCSVSL